MNTKDLARFINALYAPQSGREMSFSGATALFGSLASALPNQHQVSTFDPLDRAVDPSPTRTELS